jgi:hypothetical protein
MDRDIIGVFGISGTGKTTWIMDEIKKRPRVLILENGLEEYTDYYPSFYTKAEAAEYMFNRGRFHIIFGDDDDEDPFESIDNGSELCKAYTTSIKKKVNVALPITYIIDEAQTYTSPHKISKGFRNLIMKSRHYSTQLIYSSQRPSQISRSLTSQSSRFIIFNLSERSDVDFFYGFIGRNADQIRNLRPYHYLDCDMIKHTIEHKIILR